jgi:hypothetical protein
MYGMTTEQYNAATGGIFNDSQLVENETLRYMQRVIAGETVVESANC